MTTTSVEHSTTTTRTELPKDSGLLAGVRLRRIVATVSKFVIGVLLCANPWSAILVVGWTFRAMRRSILIGWWHRRRSAGGERGVDPEMVVGRYIDGSPSVLPRWLLGERHADDMIEPRTSTDSDPRSQRFTTLLNKLLGSLASNLRWGLVVVGCTYTITIPACGLWLGSWYDGWNTSFTKGYENAFVGLHVGLFAHLLFILAMLYVPMAWAHLAAARSPSAFFQVGLIGRLIWSRSGSITLLAGAFSLATIPVTILRAAPATFVLSNPAAWAEVEPAEVLRYATQYQTASGIYLFTAFLLLHLLAARIYRDALPELLALSPNLSARLPASIRSALVELGVIPERPPRHGVLHEAVRLSIRTPLKMIALTLACGFWFTVIAQIYVGQFLNYIPWAGWLNQPLIHIPCLQTVPAGLR